MNRFDKRSVTIAAAMLLVTVLGNLLLSGIAALAIRLGMDASLAQTALTVVFEGVFLALPALLLGKDSARRETPKAGQFLRGILLGAVMVFALNMVNVLWALVLEKWGVPEMENGVAAATSTGALMGQVLLIGALPGVCEELFFRDFLFGRLERAGTKKALVLSSVLFALLHADLWGLPAQLIAGFVLCACALCTGSVYVSMAAHTTYNSIICMLAYLQRNAEDISSVTEYVAQSGGVSPFLFSLAMYALLMALLMRRFLRDRKIENDIPPARLNPLSMVFLGVTALLLIGLTGYGLGWFG